MRNRSLHLLCFAVAGCLGCSDDDDTQMPVQDAGNDAIASLPDTAVDSDGTLADMDRLPDAAIDVSIDPDHDSNPTLVIRDTWDTVGACTIDLVDGPVILYAESSDPVGCIQIIFENTEETMPDSPFDVMVDIFYRTAEIVVENTACQTNVLTELSGGVGVVEATGVVDLGLAPLGFAETVNTASVEMEFPEDPNNPFGAFVAKVEVSQTINLNTCDN